MSRVGGATAGPLVKLFPSLAFGAGLTAAITLSGERLGFNIMLVCLLMVAAVWVAARPSLDAVDCALIALSLAPVSLVLIRDASWVVGLQVVAALGCLAVGSARAREWASILKTPLMVLARLHRGLALSVKPFGAARLQRQFGPALRAGALATFLILVFGTLFVTADAAFASLTDKWLVPEVDVALLPARVALFIGTLSLAGSLALLSPVVSGPSASPWVIGRVVGWRPELRPLDWKVALSVLNVLFGFFVVVQIAVLFGGHSHVLETTDLTYAEYARQGFFQLVVVAILTLGVIAATIAFSHHEDERNLLRILLGSLCVLTLVILVSAARRMDLYQEAYGFTRLRLLVDLSIVWLGAVFSAILVAGLRWRGGWLPRAIVGISLASCVGFGLYNPDLHIARRNIERFQATGDIDLAYLSTLSTDALGALVELPEPHRSCVVAPILARAPESEPLWSYNLSRRAASAREATPCRL